MGFTGDGRPARKVENASEASGRAGSTPPPEETISPDANITPKSATTTPTINVAPAPAPAPAPAAQPRLGFFSSLTKRLSSGPAPTTPQFDDELLNMNIEAALYPAGSNGEAFSPAAYKNLQANATGLLLKMQNGLRDRTIALHEIQEERSAEKEEAEETRLRVENLKVQLESMANQAHDQEAALKQLMSELTAEREARKEERFMRMAHEKIMAERSISSEDLEVGENEQRNKWRASASTLKSEVSFTDTDEESAEGESVFSRSRSPTILTSATESVADVSVSPSREQHGKTAAAAAAAAAGNNDKLELPPKPKFGKEPSAFQKLMRGMTGGDTTASAGAGCKTCNGQSSSMAWDTVSMLRDENKDLKHRLAEMEVAVEGALDLVSGIGVRTT
ncbi:hypothetical protein PG985_015926 [Apiospora marii]|uniref:GDP/GTP exchange factor Sec2 N-terminal domain-containing protein n=1 Tax=Apiospora marii TaxID=335849 RepID=A0ABR1S3Y5_9PEZI